MPKITNNNNKVRRVDGGCLRGGAILNCNPYRPIGHFKLCACVTLRKKYLIYRGEKGEMLMLPEKGGRWWVLGKQPL